MIQGQTNNEYKHTRNYAPTRTDFGHNTFSNIVAIKENLLKSDGTPYNIVEARAFLLYLIEQEDTAKLELISSLSA